ncbi:MAG: hypothetical protein LBJ67_12765 [Planctomycetaceae bacterium]|jgi:hypothetical protein|nr:hypothetical protein [Planctomycetaceae bacterium]
MKQEQLTRKRLRKTGFNLLWTSKIGIGVKLAATSLTECHYISEVKKNICFLDLSNAMSLTENIEHLSDWPILEEIYFNSNVFPIFQEVFDLFPNLNTIIFRHFEKEMKNRKPFSSIICDQIELNFDLIQLQEIVLLNPTNSQKILNNTLEISISLLNNDVDSISNCTLKKYLAVQKTKRLYVDAFFAPQELKKLFGAIDSLCDISVLR